MEEQFYGFDFGGTLDSTTTNNDQAGMNAFLDETRRVLIEEVREKIVSIENLLLTMDRLAEHTREDLQGLQRVVDSLPREFWDEPPQENPSVPVPEPKGEKRKAVDTGTPIDQRPDKRDRNSPMAGTSGADTDIGCAICKATIGSMRRRCAFVLPTKCGHEFCFSCLKHWVISQRNEKCPICAKKIWLASARCLSN